MEPPGPRPRLSCNRTTWRAGLSLQPDKFARRGYKTLTVCSFALVYRRFRQHKQFHDEAARGGGEG